MYLNRRSFIKTAGLSAVVAPAALNSLSSCSTGPKPFGINLWTVRDEMNRDAQGTLKYLSDCGYKQIESFTGDKGVFWGWKPEEFGKILNDLGIQMVSAHVDPKFTTDPSTESEYLELCQNLASIGAEHVFNPYPGPQKSAEDWKNLAKGLNRQGRISLAQGVRSGYHNHHQEFILTPEGEMPYHILMEETDPSMVDFELDLYWAVKIGQSPESLFKKYPGRFSFAHFKDLYKAERIAEIEASDEPRSEEWPVGASTYLGNGQLDFAKILKVGKSVGLKNFIVEQERFDASTPLEDSCKNAEYMRQLLG
jgi:sugar phosphate isomerase/epimerase